MPQRVPVRFLLAAALAGSLSLSAAAGSAPLAVSCTAAPGVPAAQLQGLCEVLTAILRDRLAADTPPRQVETADGAPPGAATLQLTVVRATEHHITAELRWQDGDRSGAAGPLSSIAVDGKLTPTWYASLSRNLLERSGFGGES